MITIDVIGFLFWMFVAFEFKHFIADYLLQNRYMLGKKNADWSFFMPLASHSGVHALFTYLILLLFGVPPMSSLFLAFVDGVTHFITDRIKAGPKYFGWLKPDQPGFWWALGWDQMSHHFYQIYIIFVSAKLIFGL